jgi:hypothetical protein
MKEKLIKFINNYWVELISIMLILFLYKIVIESTNR